MSGMKSMLAMMRAHGIPTDRVTAWTMCYFPFTMGGSVWRPGGEEIACDEPIWDCGHAIAVCHGPNDMTCVVEFTTGAIVGESLEQVLLDLREGDPKVMEEQVEKARSMRHSVTILPKGELWTRLAKARAKEDAA